MKGKPLRSFFSRIQNKFDASYGGYPSLQSIPSGPQPSVHLFGLLVLLGSRQQGDAEGLATDSEEETARQRASVQGAAESQSAQTSAGLAQDPETESTRSFHYNYFRVVGNGRGL